jgi:hypothetical protein
MSRSETVEYLLDYGMSRSETVEYLVVRLWNIS